MAYEKFPNFQITSLEKHQDRRYDTTLRSPEWALSARHVNMRQVVILTMRSDGGARYILVVDREETSDQMCTKGTRIVYKLSILM